DGESVLKLRHGPIDWLQRQSCQQQNQTRLATESPTRQGQLQRTSKTRVGLYGLYSFRPRPESRLVVQRFGLSATPLSALGLTLLYRRPYRGRERPYRLLLPWKYSAGPV